MCLFFFIFVHTRSKWDEKKTSKIIVTTIDLGCCLAIRFVWLIILQRKLSITRNCLGNWFARLSTLDGIAWIIITRNCLGNWFARLSTLDGIAWIIDLQSCLLNGIAWVIDFQSCLLNWITWKIYLQSCLLSDIAWIIYLQISLLNGIAWIIVVTKFSTKWNFLDKCHRQHAAIID